MSFAAGARPATSSARRGQEAGAELARRGQEATGEWAAGWPTLERRLAELEGRLGAEDGAEVEGERRTGAADTNPEAES